MSKHNLLVELEMEEKPVKGSPSRPNPKPRKRQKGKGSHESLLESNEQDERPRPKPRRSQKIDSQDELSTSSETNDETRKVKSTSAFDNPVFLGDDDTRQSKRTQGRSDSAKSSPSVPKKQLDSSRPHKVHSFEDSDYSISDSEPDSYLHIENEVKQKTRSKPVKPSSQLFEVNYESPKRSISTKSPPPKAPGNPDDNGNTLKSPTSREKRRKDKKGHVAIQIEKQKDENKDKIPIAFADSPLPPEDSTKEEKKSSGKIGGLVGRWKNLLSSKSSGSKPSEKDKTETGQEKEESKTNETQGEISDLKLQSVSPESVKKSKKSEMRGKTKTTKSHHKLQIKDSSGDESSASGMSEDEDTVKGLGSKSRTKSQPDDSKSSIEPTTTSKKPPETSKEKLKDRLKSITRKSTKESLEEFIPSIKTKPISSIEVEESSPKKVKKSRSHRKETSKRKAPPRDTPDQDLLLGITIHCTDMLPLDPNVLHPVVKVTAMNQDGSLLRKSCDSKSLDHLEDLNKSEKRKRRKGRKSSGNGEVSPLNAVLPIMTQPFHFTFALRNPSFSPSWNELLLYEEPFERFVNENSQAILFFEIMDFLPMEKTSAAAIPGFHGTDAGWYKVAWAFLKPVGSNGHLNIEKKLRLQLYKPMKIKAPKVTPGHTLPEVYFWWKSEKKLKLLNTTLYVTVKGVLPPQGTKASLRQLLTMKKDELTEAIIESQLASQKQNKKSKDNANNDPKAEQSQEIPEKENIIQDKRKLQNWSRLEGQSCRIPNKLLASLPSSQIESLNITISGNVHTLKFSPCGLHLAAGLDTEELHVLLIFEIPSGTLLKCLKSHHGLIYDLDWKQIDEDNNSYVNYIASASADATAVVWSMRNDDPRTLSLVKTLHHPSFVYCVKFHPTHPSTVVTGCYDCLIRVWSISSGRSKPTDNSNDSCPLFILDGHGGFVNTLEFTRQGLHLFSGDGEGCVLKWNIKSPSKKKSWRIEKDARMSDHKVPVNSLSLHPNESRLLVHLRDNSMKIIDTLNLITIQYVGGLVNDKLQIRSKFSPCGNLILSGCENPSVCIWDADTSAILQFLSPPNNPHCFVSAVDYHPFDFYLAVGLASSISEPTPILLFAHLPPNLQSLATLNVSVANFKSNLLKSKSRSLEDSDLLPDSQKTKKHVRFAVERGDSSEKFQAIINKLDKALQDVKEPRRHSSSFQLPRSLSLDFPQQDAVNNNASQPETTQRPRGVPLPQPRKPRKTSQDDEASTSPRTTTTTGHMEPQKLFHTERVPADDPHDSTESPDDSYPPKSYAEIHLPSTSLPKGSEIQKLSPKNLPKPKRRPPTIHSPTHKSSSGGRPLQDEPLLEDTNENSQDIFES